MAVLMTALTVLSFLVSVVGVLVTLAAWLYPDARHSVVARFSFLLGQSNALANAKRQSAKQQPRADETDLAHVRQFRESLRIANAWDLVSLGEHLWYLANINTEPVSEIEESISALRQHLEKCRFVVHR